MSTPQLIQNEAFHQAMEFPWKATFLSLMRPVVRDELIDCSGYPFSRELPGLMRQSWSAINEYTIVDPFRLGWLIDLLCSVEQVDGDIVECGSFMGGSGILMGLVLRERKIHKRIHLFDSFEGLPEPDTSKDKGYRRGQFKSNFEKCMAQIEELGLGDMIQVHRGWFRETITSLLEDLSLKIALLHIDCDLYASTRDCFPPLYPLVTESGVVVLDDFNDGGRGEKTAILEVLNGRPELFQVGPAPSCHFRKGVARPKNGMVIRDAGFAYSFTRLFEDEDYMDWLGSLLGEDYPSKIASFGAS